MMQLKGIKAVFLAGMICSSDMAIAAYCSTSFGVGYINQGDTMNTVQAVFGQPTKSEKQKVQTPGFQTTQYWMYQNANTKETNPLGLYPPKVTVTQTAPVVVFQIVDGKVAALTENGKNVASTRACKGGTIQVNSDANAVTAACGQPSSVSMDNKSNSSDNAQEVTVWTYGNGSLTIQFDTSGKVTSIVGCS